MSHRSIRFRPYPHACFSGSVRLRSNIACIALCTILIASLSAPSSAQRRAASNTLQTDAHEIVAGAVAIIAAVVTVTVIVVVNHSHHTLKGCTAAVPGGLALRTSDAATFLLEGDLAQIKPGERISLHGSRQKATKAAPVFHVEKLNKDYGPCPASSVP